MLTIFMIAIPCIGFIYTIFGAIYAKNESRRNFYRAHLAWLAVVLVLYIPLVAIGTAPDIRKLYDQYRHELIVRKNQLTQGEASPSEKKRPPKKQEDSE